MAVTGDFKSYTFTSTTLDQVLTSIATIGVKNYTKLKGRLTASAQDIDQAQIDVKFHSEGTVFTTVTGPTTTAANTVFDFIQSARLDNLSGASAHFSMDVSAVAVVDFKIAFAADNGTYVLDIAIQ